MKFVSEKVVARNELAVKRGQLTYLKNLAKVNAVVMPKWYFSLQGGRNL